MINTDKSVRYMPRNLAAFKRYAETYDCTFFVTTSLHFGELNYALLFYHAETDMPYVLVYVGEEDEAPQIYANYQADNWDSMFMTENYLKLRESDNISNDMNKFLGVIRECRKST